MPYCLGCCWLFTRASKHLSLGIKDLGDDLWVCSCRIGAFIPWFLFLFCSSGLCDLDFHHALWHSKESQSKLLTELLVASLAFDPTVSFLLKFGGGTGWLEGIWGLWNSMGEWESWGDQQVGCPSGVLSTDKDSWSSEFLREFAYLFFWLMKCAAGWIMYTIIALSNSTGQKHQYSSRASWATDTNSVPVAAGILDIHMTLDHRHLHGFQW